MFWVTIVILFRSAMLDLCMNTGPNQFYITPNKLGFCSTRINNNFNKLSEIMIRET